MGHPTTRCHIWPRWIGGATAPANLPCGPPSLFLLVRVFQGLFVYLERLEATLPWWPGLEREVDAETLAAARAFEPPRIERERRPRRQADARPSPRSAPEGRDRRTRAGADDPRPPRARGPHARGGDPEEVRRRVAESGVDIAEIEARAKRTRLAPQLLLLHCEAEKSCGVWLE